MIDADRVRQVAALARLRLEPDEVATFAAELARILDWVRKLDELDTTGVEATTHPVELTAGERDDEVTPGLGVEAALAGAPERIAGGFGAPKIIE